VILEQQTYPGDTGITIDRAWTVPAGLDDGKYWIRVEYWSYQAGNEANAEVTFYVCNETGSICVTKLQDTDCNGVISPADTPLAGWWMCLTTPLGDTYCLQTGPDGRVCWDGLPLGDYTVFEILEPGWIVVGPDSYQFTLGGDPVELTFLNFRYEDCARACCIDEQCYILLERECLAQGGEWHPDWTTCQDNPCRLPHVCCVGEDCYLVLDDECAALGGVFHPEWDSCGPPNPCALPHVCCVGEDCYVILETDCAAMGGVFHPEWDSCGPPNPCQVTPATPDTWGGVKNLFR
jgi:hypothetical protein